MFERARDCLEVTGCSCFGDRGFVSCICIVRRKGGFRKVLLYSNCSMTMSCGCWFLTSTDPTRRSVSFCEVDVGQ